MASRLLLAWLVSLTLLGPGCRRASEVADRAPGPASGVDLVIPRPNLEGIEEAARRQIGERIAAAEALAAEADPPPRELARALGGLGLAYHAYEFLEAAESCYRRSTELDPEAFRWPYYLGFLLQTQGRFEEAVAALDRALALRPDDPAAVLRAAAVAQALGRAERAARLYRRALRVEPAAAKAHQGLGALALAADEPLLAIEHLETALRLQPAASILHYSLGRAYAAAGREQESRRQLELRGNAEVTFPDPLIAAIDLTARGAALRLTRAAVALSEGRVDVALREYRQALEADPDQLAARLDYGLLLAAGGDLESGERQVRQVLSRDSDHAQAHDALGRILEQRGADEEALAHFRRAITLDPDLQPARLHLATTLLRLDRPAAAEREFDQVLARDPGAADARLGRARARLDLGRPAPAAEDLRTLLSARSDNALAHLYLGEALQRLEDAAALEHYRRAAESGLPASLRALSHLGAGNILAARGDWRQAATELEAALALAPDLHQAHFNLAGIHARRGRFDLAAEHYSRVLELRPDLLTARLYLADASLRLGRHESAAEQFAAAVAADPQHEAARLGEALALVALQRYAAARERLAAGLEALPRSGPLAHALARLLAACPRHELRNGARALELALAVQSSQDRLQHAETVAMALAEVGRFADAGEWQRAVIERARAEGQEASLPRLQGHLELYQAGEPCCAGEWWVGDF